MPPFFYRAVNYVLRCSRHNLMRCNTVVFKGAGQGAVLFSRSVMRGRCQRKLRSDDKVSWRAERSFTMRVRHYPARFTLVLAIGLLGLAIAIVPALAQSTTTES